MASVSVPLPQCFQLEIVEAFLALMPIPIELDPRRLAPGKEAFVNLGAVLQAPVAAL